MQSELVAGIRETTITNRDIGDQVAEQLKRASDLQKMVEKLQGELNNANKEIGNRLTEVSALKALKIRKESLDAKEAALAAREAELDHKEEIAKLTITYEQSRVSDHQKMVELIFRNKKVRTSGTVPLAVPMGHTAFHNADGSVSMQDCGSSVQVQPHDLTEEEL